MVLMDNDNNGYKVNEIDSFFRMQPHNATRAQSETQYAGYNFSSDLFHSFVSFDALAVVIDDESMM